MNVPGDNTQVPICHSHQNCLASQDSPGLDWLYSYSTSPSPVIKRRLSGTGALTWELDLHIVIKQHRGLKKVAFADWP